MTKQVDEIRRALEARKEHQGIKDGLIRFLMAKGVCRSLSYEIASEFFKAEQDVSNLQESLMKRINTSAPPTMPASIILIGPTGIGKTTTLLKLASFYLAAKKKVTICDLDDNPRLRAIADSWKVPYLSEYKEAIDTDLTLIDTPGCNYYQPERVEQLAILLDTLPSSELLLTLSATTKDVDLFGAIHQFSCLEPSGLIFTKLDETLAGGVLLNVCQKTDYPLRYIAYGFPLPGSVEIADPKLIANKILTDLNCEEFSSLRQLIVE